MTREIKVTVNGRQRQSAIEPGTTLMDFLRDTLGYKGVKVCCNTGECGACTILLDGKLVNSCVVLADDAADREIVTIEGVARNGELTPLQRAFIDLGASQCGYCTPGLIMTATYLLEHNEHPSTADIKEALSGNICRCTGYTKVIEAVQMAAEGMHDPVAG